MMLSHSAVRWYREGQSAHSTPWNSGAGGEDLEGIGLGHSSGLHNHELGIAGVSLGHQELEGPLEPVSPALILYCQDLFLDVQGRPGDAKRTSPLAVPVYHALVISAMDVKRV